MENDMQVKYDHLCYAILANVRHLTGEADCISFKGFDPKDEEHLCVLSVTVACLGILGKEEIALDCGFWARRKLRKKYQHNCNIIAFEDDEEGIIDIEDMLTFMREPARELCGEDFTFADIYREYYTEKGE